MSTPSHYCSAKGVFINSHSAFVATGIFRFFSLSPAAAKGRKYLLPRKTMRERVYIKCKEMPPQPRVKSWFHSRKNWSSLNEIPFRLVHAERKRYEFLCEGGVELIYCCCVLRRISHRLCVRMRANAVRNFFPLHPYNIVNHIFPIQIWEWFNFPQHKHNWIFYRTYNFNQFYLECIKWCRIRKLRKLK